MTTFTHYTQAIVFNDTLSHVLLLTKLSGPAFLKGKDNYPGGHVEPGETAQEGAARELEEEAGLKVESSSFHSVTTLEFPNGKVDVFAAAIPDALFKTYQSLTSEPIRSEAVEAYLALSALDPQRAPPDVPTNMALARDVLKAVQLSRQPVSSDFDLAS